jgi:hypothetical protein
MVNLLKYFKGFVRDYEPVVLFSSLQIQEGSGNEQYNTRRASKRPAQAIYFS